MASARPEPPCFDAAFRQHLRLLIRWRRDVRHFRNDPVSPDLIDDLLGLAESSPSVGFSQPARFVLVESEAARQAVCRNFEDCNRDALHTYSGPQAAHYSRLKLAGLQQAPVHLAVFCDDSTQRGNGLGRRTMPETLRYSVVASIQTLWLTLRAHGLGLGWVSILDPVRLRAELALPEEWTLIAYCCIGYPDADDETPELERTGWQQRREACAPIRR